MTASPARNRLGRDELLSRAEGLLPRLRERAAQCDAARRCPEETVADFVESGLLHICQPARFGGYELGWDVLCEVNETLARANGSQAWVHHVYVDHSQMVGTFPLEAQDDVWSKDPDTRIAASFAPVGTARPVSGGVVYSGDHTYSSGIDHAGWAICGGHVVGDGAPRRCFFLVPRRDLAIIDDWHVMGLAGTGSKSFTVRDVFVPDHRILDGEAAARGAGPGTFVNRAPIFRVPRGGVTALGFASVAVGIARGFLEEYLRYAKARRSRGTAVALSAGTQIGFGAASAEIEAASTIYRAAARGAMATLEDSRAVSEEQALRAGRDAAFAAQLALNAAHRLFNAAGGPALFLTTALQRHLHDLYAATAHNTLIWDKAAEAYGRNALLGGQTPA